MDQDAAAGVLDDLAGLVDRQLGAIALLAEVQEHEMTNAVAAGPLEDRSHQLGRLAIGEMAPVSQVPRDQGRRTARSFLHGHIVIELDTQDVDVSQAIGHALRPAPAVSQVAHSDCPRASSGDRLDPKTERRTVVSQGNWLDTESAGSQEGLAVVVPHQPQPIEILKPLVDLQGLAVRLV